MERPVPPQLSLPSYISWFPPLIRFLASALQYQQDSEAYMDELEAHQEPHGPQRPEVMLYNQDDVWMNAFLEEILAGTNFKTYYTAIGNPNQRALDGWYWLPATKEDFLTMVNYSWAEKRQWIQDQFDCDDFSFGFKSHMVEDFGTNCVGVVIDVPSSHAYNLVVFKDRTWALWEPDSNVFVQPGEDSRHSFREGLILL